MKIGIILVTGLVMMIGCLAGCGSKGKTFEVTQSGGEMVYTTDDYSISCSEGDFEVVEDRNDAIKFLYSKEGVNAEGSNQIIITKEESTTVEDIAKEMDKSSNGNSYDSVVGSQEIPAKIYTTTQDAPDGNGLILVDTCEILQSGNDVIIIEIIRTVGADDETEMTIDGSFTHTLESFVLK